MNSVQSALCDCHGCSPTFTHGSKPTTARTGGANKGIRTGAVQGPVRVLFIHVFFIVCVFNALFHTVRVLGTVIVSHTPSVQT